MWPTDDDLKKGKEFEKNHPHMMDFFYSLFLGFLQTTLEIFQFIGDFRNFLTKIHVLKPSKNDGMERSLTVCWIEEKAEGYVISGFGSDHYHRDEMGFDMPAHGKHELAVKILERLGNLRTNRGPGNVQDARHFFKKENVFHVYLEENREIQFRRYKFGKDAGTVQVTLEKEEPGICLEAMEKVLKEPPDSANYRRNRYMDKNGNEVSREQFYADMPELMNE